MHSDAMIRSETSGTLIVTKITSEPGDRKDMLKKGLGFVAVVAFLGIAYFLLREEFPAPPAPAPAKITPSEAAPPVPRPGPIRQPVDPASEENSVNVPQSPPITLPSLEQSDAFIRERLEPFALPPLWVKQDDLMQRFAALADAATRGDWPRRPLRFLEPAEKFRVIERDGRLYADPDNGARFDADLDMLEQIEPAAAAQLLITIDPLLEAALRNLGRPVNGRDLLLDAIDSVLAAPAPEGDPELVQPKVLYEYADPALENLPPLEKQLLRLGPDNLKRLKRYLTSLRAELSRARP